MIYQYFDLAKFRELLEKGKSLGLQQKTLGTKTLEEIEEAMLPFEGIEADSNDERHMPDELQSKMADLHFSAHRLEMLMYIQSNTTIDCLNLAVK